MAFYYLSDLHLREQNEPKAQALKSFLSSEIEANDVLVLGGDIFDLFVGSDTFFRRQFASILDEIGATAKRGARVFFLEGNHDFHVECAFAEVGGVEVRADEFAYEWEGRKIWICHGDEINRQDYGYLFLRWITRTFFVRFLLRVLPGSLIAAIGNWSSGTSRKYTDVARANAAQVSATQELFRNYAREKIAEGFHFVLIGHSHIADKLLLASEGKQGEYVNLGFLANELPVLKIGTGGAASEVLTWPR